MKSPNVTRTVAFGTSVTFSLEYVLWRWLAIYSKRYFRRRFEHKSLSPCGKLFPHVAALPAGHTIVIESYRPRQQ